MQTRKLVLLATDRYSINIDDFYMFYRRTRHKIVAVLHHVNCPSKSWWVNGYFPDPARDRLLEPLDFNRLEFMSWSCAEELLSSLDQLDFDYVCMGNGNGDEQQKVIEHVGLGRCLFSEYGWLPWSRNFYISRNGCGYQSEISQVDGEALDRQPLRTEEIKAFRRRLLFGFPVLYRGFVYVPLQKDVNDFKFDLCDFRDNPDFLDFIHEVVPSHMRIYVKEHPLYRKHYNYRKYGRGRFQDVSDRHLSKAGLYRRMAAMICINSTSILEALAFGGKVFAYGQDLFLNKDLVHFRVTDPAEFEARLEQPQLSERCERFASLLFERQVDRHRCLADDHAYIENHYWNRSI